MINLGTQSWSKYYLIIVRNFDVISYVLKLRGTVCISCAPQEHSIAVRDASVHSGGNHTSENSEQKRWRGDSEVILDVATSWDSTFVTMKNHIKLS